ncbi:hypothetical protein HAHE_42550 [Haloferula helveola]|uniref:CHAT domain-containing protein n=1 Tax=Haloferula helveola TaxID=490095 RepID=A0ABN6HDM2_9BACT|nr:hypothetical protein HAHE_42550 [Haloferula helveola]
MRFLILILLLAGPLAALDLSDPVAAEAELEDLVEEWRDAWATNPDAETGQALGSTLHALGIVERQLGMPADAVAHLEEACALLEIHGPELLADAREALAIALQDEGEVIRSEAVLREVLAERRRHPDNRASLAATLDHLALNLLVQGEYPEGGALLEEALELLPKSDLAGRARLLGHLGRLQHNLGSHAKAVSTFRSALDLEFSDPELRFSLRSQQALAKFRLGRVDEAIAESEAIAKEARELLEDRPLLAAPYQNNFGALSLALGFPEAAIASFTHAKEMLQASLGTDHPGLIGVHNNLGVAFQKTGQFEEARAELEIAAELQHRYLPPTHLRAAEIERNLAINALLEGSPDAPELARAATKTGLAILNRLIESGSERERLNFLERFDLVSLPCAIGDPEAIANLLLASKARLLDAMISTVEQTTTPTWTDIRDQLPPDTAFVDFCRYSDFGEDATTRYGAILLTPHQSPRWIELGTADDLHRWLDAFRRRINWNSAILAGESPPPPPLKMAGVLKSMHRRFWAPIEQALPAGTEHLAISPDGAVHFIPFSALVDEDNRLLCRKYLQLTQVTSGRDLLPGDKLEPLSESPWAVLTISDFPRPTPSKQPDLLMQLLASLEPMPGTKQEARALKKEAPGESIFLSDSEATEMAIAKLPSPPGVLHLGCHAFYLGNGAADSEAPLDFDENSQLFQSSGLVLHRGALHQADGRRSNPGDDLLFPTEIAALPLHGTRLVTLSSCDSGSGTPINGEGILGLKRAFAIAGAREVAVALWPISDQSTPEFMERFYQLASRSDRPGQSLWQAQSEMLEPVDSDNFELSVLRYAPFVLTQNHPLRTGSAIERADDGPNWWILAAALPLLLFAAARMLGKRSESPGSQSPDRRPD